MHKNEQKSRYRTDWFCSKGRKKTVEAHQKVFLEKMPPNRDYDKSDPTRRSWTPEEANDQKEAIIRGLLI